MRRGHRRDAIAQPAHGIACDRLIARWQCGRAVGLLEVCGDKQRPDLAGATNALDREVPKHVSAFQDLVNRQAQLR